MSVSRHIYFMAQPHPSMKNICFHIFTHPKYIPFALEFKHCMYTFKMSLIAFYFCIFSILSCSPAKHSLFIIHEDSQHAKSSSTKGRLNPKKVMNVAKKASPVTQKFTDTQKMKKRKMCPIPSASLKKAWAKSWQLSDHLWYLEKFFSCIHVLS